MKSIARIFLYTTLMACILGSCTHNGTSETQTTKDSDETSELPYGVSDTIQGRKVSTECAIAIDAMQSIRRRAENLASPSMLATFRAQYKEDIAEAEAAATNINGEERQFIRLEKDTIDMVLAEKRKKLEVPASGVIDNLNNCISRVKTMKSDTEMYRFLDYRRSMIRNLDNIHLCVEEQSNQIPTVKKLARQLKLLVEEKKTQFGMK